MVSVPPPLSVTLALPTNSSVKLPVEFSVIVPALLMLLPFTVSEVPLLNPSPSSESMVRLRTCAPRMFSVTADAPERPLSMKAFVPAFGTAPLDQLAALFQTPPAAGPVQHVPPDGH